MKEISITVQGNVGTAPEERVDRKGRTMCTFRVASAARWFNRESREWQDGVTNWFSVSCFGRLASHAVQSLSKGDPVVVSGRLELREYESAGGRGTSADLRAETLGHDMTQGITQFRRAAHAPTTENSTAAQSADLSSQSDQQHVAETDNQEYHQTTSAGSSDDGWHNTTDEPLSGAPTDAEQTEPRLEAASAPF